MEIKYGRWAYFSFFKCNVFAQPEGAAQNHSIENIKSVTDPVMWLIQPYQRVGL